MPAAIVVARIPSGGDQRGGEPVMPAQGVEGIALAEADDGNQQVEGAEERVELWCLAGSAPAAWRRFS